MVRQLKLYLISRNKFINKVNKRIDHIISDIADGFSQDEFKSKMQELKEKKELLQVNISELKQKSKSL